VIEKIRQISKEKNICSQIADAINLEHDSASSPYEKNLFR